MKVQKEWNKLFWQETERLEINEVAFYLNLFRLLFTAAILFYIVGIEASHWNHLLVELWLNRAANDNVLVGKSKSKDTAIHDRLIV